MRYHLKLKSVRSDHVVVLPVQIDLYDFIIGRLNKESSQLKIITFSGRAFLFVTNKLDFTKARP